MDREPVDSSQIKSVGYNARTKTLEVAFLSPEAVVRYAGVPPSKFASLMAAQSHGEYLSAKIKGKYKFRTLK